ncbi:MAG: NADH-quinone oxidoreductase subunit J family protein [Candidatus Binataceae bacterium]
MPLGLFVFLAAMLIISGFGVILQRNPVHCLMSLVLALLIVGILFIALGATTIGFLQIIVYVGAIMILFLFVIWLLNLGAETGRPRNLALKFFGAFGASALAGELFTFVGASRPATGASHAPNYFGSVASLATSLYSSYLIAFEATSLLLLVAIIGAVALVRRTSTPASVPSSTADPEAPAPPGRTRSA